jgi:hypothetical protein
MNTLQYKLKKMGFNTAFTGAVPQWLLYMLQACPSQWYVRLGRLSRKNIVPHHSLYKILHLMYTHTHTIY